jgi:hypothetical protein
MLGHLIQGQDEQHQQRLATLLNEATNRLDPNILTGRSACTSLSTLAQTKSSPSIACIIDSVWDNADFITNLQNLHNLHELSNSYDKPDQEFGGPEHNSPPLPAVKEDCPVSKRTPPPGWKQMDKFPPDKVTDFKHVIYNLLVDNHNNLGESSFVRPCIVEENGVMRSGFCFTEGSNPEKRLPELYAKHIRKCRLDLEDDSSILIQDLYKYYMRACVELLSKYFEKLDKYTYLDDDVHLFVPNGTLEDAEKRIKNMPTRSRKKKRKLG